MNFLFGNIFWGVLLLLWGLSMILKGLNIVDLPLVKIFIAVIIIMFGIRLLVGSGSSSRVRTEGYHSRIVTTGGTEYTTVFASQTIDLTDLKPDSRPLEITAVFGSAYVELPDDIDFQIEPTAVFGSTVVPPKPQRAYNNPLGRVQIDATAVFGRLEFTYKPSNRPSNQRSNAADPAQGAPGDSL